MDLDRLKPNFQRYASAFLADHKAKAEWETKLDYQKHLKSLERDWNEIIKGRILYDANTNDKIKTLLEEFEIEDFYNDFHLWDFYYRIFLPLNERKNNKIDIKIKESEELQNALMFLIDNENKEIKIEFKHKTKNISSSITSNILIHLIKIALLRRYGYDDEKISNFNPEQIQEWIEVVKQINKEGKSPVKKGRKNKHLQTGRHIEKLQFYLQDFTIIKAEEGILISRRQASFICKFLKIYGLIDDIAHEEDNIRHIFEKHMKEKKKEEDRILEFRKRFSRLT